MTLTQSTVSGNSTTGNFAYGGGIFAGARDAHPEHRYRQPSDWTRQSRRRRVSTNYVNNASVSISGSIIAGNTAAGGSPDLRPDPDSVAVANSVNYSLIGDTSGSGITGTTGDGQPAERQPAPRPAGRQRRPDQDPRPAPRQPGDRRRRPGGRFQPGRV